MTSLFCIGSTRPFLRSLVVGCISLAGGSIALAGSLEVQVIDARTRAPITGAVVQVGPSPGIPFDGNSGVTDANGEITLSDPMLIGPQTVTAAAVGHARTSVIDSALGSIMLVLRPSFADTLGLLDPAEIHGTVTNVATVNNDGNLDIAIVLPALRLRDILGEGIVPIEVPADTVDFPIVGPTVLPGNVVVPTQTEAFFFTFSKPLYHFSVEDHVTYDIVAVAGRVPLEALQGDQEDALNQVTPREVGAERSIAMNGDRALDVNSDLNLTQNLTVSVPEAPNGTQIQVFSVADLPQANGDATILYDSKFALADTQDSFTLSGRNPSGDLSDAQAYVVGVYQDSSVAGAFQAGRIDRTSLTLPASRTIEDFFELPDLNQDGRTFEWSDVERVGITSSPTWALASFELAPTTAGDPTVPTEALWDVLAPASALSFDLPLLEPSAPGGLRDPAGTIEDDRLLWGELLGDPPGTVTDVLDDPFAGLTTFSRRTIAVAPLPTGVGSPSEPAVGQQADALRLEISPNPASGLRVVRWATATAPGQGTEVRWSLFDATGREIHQGKTRVEGPNGQILVGAGLPPGVHWVRVQAGGRVGRGSLVVAH